jgi:hyperosmotically inducible protein
MKAMKLLNLAVASAMLIPMGLLAAEVDQRQTPTSATEREVRHELVMLSNVTVFDDLSFSVAPSGSGGAVVTLTGSVTRPVLKSTAVNVVKGLESVDRVIDNIEVLPLSPNDDRIRAAAYRKIYRDSALSTRYGFQSLPSIRIIVKNGNIRLTGFVANEMDRTIANIRAREVNGAFSVTNDLKLDRD